MEIDYPYLLGFSSELIPCPALPSRIDLTGIEFFSFRAKLGWDCFVHIVYFILGFLIGFLLGDRIDYWWNNILKERDIKKEVFEYGFTRGT